jgi:GlcNAc-P-P-Und epimerase
MDNPQAKLDYSPKSALIVGGAGFIGTHLARHLLKRDCAVTTLDLRPRSDDLKVPHLLWDVRTPLPKDISEPPEVIFNFAAVHRTPGHPDREYYETNIPGAINVTNWAEAVGANTICFTSSISVYGPGEDEKIESTTPAPVSPYGISKLMAEQIHTKWAQQDDQRKLTIIRPAVIFGAGEHGNFTRLAQALKQHRFFYPGRDDTLKSCGYVRDLVRAACFTMGRPERIETFNYCYPDHYTIKDVCEAFHEVAGYRTPVAVPDKLMSFPLRVSRTIRLSPATKLAQRIEKLRTSTNVMPQALIDAGFTWDTDLTTGLQEWHQECAGGDFN